MAQVVYSDEAFTDFERIIEFLLETSPETAEKALESIRGAIGILEAHPLIGRRVDDHIRELVISRGATGYLALYRFVSRVRRRPQSCGYGTSARQVTETDCGSDTSHYERRTGSATKRRILGGSAPT